MYGKFGMICTLRGMCGVRRTLLGVFLDKEEGRVVKFRLVKSACHLLHPNLPPGKHYLLPLADSRQTDDSLFYCHFKELYTTYICISLSYLPILRVQGYHIYDTLFQALLDK